MKSSNRRVFILQAAGCGAALMAVGAVHAQTAMVNEKDAQAASLGYVSDTNKADAKKYPKHLASQMCGNCQVYAGKPGEPAGPCAIFPGKLVSSKAWCSAYVKKAA
jgi:hypothetical protein